MEIGQGWISLSFPLSLLCCLKSMGLEGLCCSQYQKKQALTLLNICVFILLFNQKVQILKYVFRWQPGQDVKIPTWNSSYTIFFQGFKLKGRLNHSFVVCSEGYSMTRVQNRRKLLKAAAGKPRPLPLLICQKNRGFRQAPADISILYGHVENPSH